MRLHPSRNWNADRIKGLRLRFHLSQRAFAQLVGVLRQQTISEWEMGDHVPGRAYSRLLEITEKKLIALWQEAGEDVLKFQEKLNCYEGGYGRKVYAKKAG